MAVTTILFSGYPDSVFTNGWFAVRREPSRSHSKINQNSCWKFFGILGVCVTRSAASLDPVAKPIPEGFRAAVKGVFQWQPRF